MRRIKNLFKLYLPFSKAGIKIELAYKAQIVMWILISFIQTFFVLFLYLAYFIPNTAKQPRYNPITKPIKIAIP